MDHFKTLDSAPNNNLIRVRYANGVVIRGYYSHADDTVSTEAGAPQARGDFWRWAPL